MPRRRNIAAELVAARAAGMPWKALTVRYRLSRSRLYQIWTTATRGGLARDPCACPHCGRPLPALPATPARDEIASSAV